MKKIRSEFLTEKEANRAMDKIKSYCGNAEILYYGNNVNPGYDGYENYDYYGHIPDETFMGFPEMGSLGFGSFGMIANWSVTPYSLTDNYRHNILRSHYSGHNPPGRATLEADVADDNFEYVKEKLYSLGAIAVT